MKRTLYRVAGLLAALAPLVASAQNISLVEAFPGLRFDHPVFLTCSPDSTDRLFVVQQDGVIKVFPNDPTAARADTFLNVRSKMAPPEGEAGLLGLAFHPAFAANGTFYINYTAPGSGGNPLRTVVEQYRVLPDSPDRADTSSGVPILEFDQPYVNHNGGMIAFGEDSSLYIASGDGGSGNDPQNNAQDRRKLLGKILRIDVDHPDPPLTYGIPADNPFAADSGGVRREIWAYGFRNPWRFSFDSAQYRGRQSLWVADVGQMAREEIDRVTSGGNYGWRIMEGSICRPGGGACDTTGLLPPVAEYGRDLGISVTGGSVYRGTRVPSLWGAYIYSDFGSGRIWALRAEGDSVLSNTLLSARLVGISAYGIDQNHELYAVDYSRGMIFRFTEAPARVEREGSGVPEALSLLQNYPNPFNPETVIGFTLPVRSVVSLKVFDALGREVASLAQGTFGPGAFRTRFHGAGLPSGSYFYRLRVLNTRGNRTGEFEQSRRMILLR